MIKKGYMQFLTDLKIRSDTGEILSPTTTTNGSGGTMNVPTGKCLRSVYLNDKSFSPVHALAFRYGPCFRIVVVCKLIGLYLVCMVRSSPCFSQYLEKCG